MPDSLILYPLRPSSSQCYTQCKEGGPYEVKRLRLVGPEVPVQYIAPKVGRHIPVQGYDIRRALHTLPTDPVPENFQSTHYISNRRFLIFLENLGQHPSAVRHPYTSRHPSPSISHPYIHTHLHTHIHQSSIICRQLSSNMVLC